MNDYVYLFTVFIAMGAVTAAERLLPFACSSWLRKQRWVGVVGDFLRLPLWFFWFCTLRPVRHSPEAAFLSPKLQASSLL